MNFSKISLALSYIVFVDTG